VLKGTGQWFLDDSNFRAWSNSKEKKILFCSGDPGTGKTALATIATSHLESEHCDKDEVVVCLYCDYNQQREQSLSYLLRNILHQLVSAKEHLPYVVQKMREKHDKQRTNPSLDEIERALRVVMQTFSRVWVVVDALDECEPALQESFYTKLCSLASQPNTALMVTSRPLPKIQELFAGVPRINIVSSKSDMQLYAEARIRTELESFVVSDMELTTEVAQGVAEAADGRYVKLRETTESFSKTLAFYFLTYLTQIPTCQTPYRFSEKQADRT
jgi:Cdc6-like AAA superfamily ATPase